MLVIGFGKVGSSIAETLGRRNIRTIVHDTDPVRKLQAKSNGFETLPKEASYSEANFVFSATGNKGLKEEDYPKLRDGTFIATVTSGDDELDLDGLFNAYVSRPLTGYIDHYTSRTEKHSLYLLNRGNAVNFVHQAVVGSYIYLVQAEILRAFQLIEKGKSPNEILEVPYVEQQRIAALWLNKFNNDEYSINIDFEDTI